MGAMMTVVASGDRRAWPPVRARRGGRHDARSVPGLIAFTIVVLLGVATFFLVRSMMHHIGKVPPTFDDDGLRRAVRLETSASRTLAALVLQQRGSRASPASAGPSGNPDRACSRGRPVPGAAPAVSTPSAMIDVSPSVSAMLRIVLHQGAAIRFVAPPGAKRAHELAGELDAVHRQLLQVAERGVPGAEVVDEEAHTEIGEALSRSTCTPSSGSSIDSVISSTERRRIDP